MLCKVTHCAGRVLAMHVWYTMALTNVCWVGYPCIDAYTPVILIIHDISSQTYMTSCQPCLACCSICFDHICSIPYNGLESCVLNKITVASFPEGALGVAAVVMRSLLDDPNSLCLVGECRELEKHFGTNYTD